MNKTHRLHGRDSQASLADLLLRIKKNLRWSLSLGNKLRKEVPMATAVGVFATLTSQASMLLAFFLPLKVIIMLGSDRPSRFTLPQLQGLDHQSMIMLLSMAAVFFYGLHLLATRVVKLAASRGAEQLLTRTGKLVLFENQDEIAGSAYKQFTTALAGGVFVLLSLLVLLWLYPLIPLLLLAYTGLASLLLLLGGRHPGLRDQLENNLETWLPIATTIGFLLAFALLVSDFLIDQPPPLTPSILALLLTRQLSKRSQTAIASLAKLTRKRVQIDALFFNRQVMLKDSPQDKTIWPLLLPEQRGKWVPQMLASTLGEECGSPLLIRWWPLGESNVVALHCEFPDGPAMLIKLFDSTRTTQAVHEATLLSDACPGIPAPVWRGMAEIQGFHCHIFELPDCVQSPGTDTGTSLWGVRTDLLQSEPPAELVARYARSHPVIGQRLNNKLLRRLMIATDPHTEPALVQASQRLDSWREHLRSMPLAFVLPFEQRNMLEDGSGKVFLLHWGEWALEPCGFGWPSESAEHEELQQALDAAKRVRSDLAPISVDHLLLTALSSTFERSLLDQQYDAALALLVPINDCLDRLEK